MKRLLATALLSLTCLAAHAEWILITDGVGEEQKFYGESTSRQWTGTTVKIWMMMDLKKPDKIDAKRSFLSTKEQIQFNCQEKTQQILFSAFYSQRMGQGETIYRRVEPLKLEPIVPDSIFEDIRQWACQK
jgi:hypothetical protein